MFTMYLYLRMFVALILSALLAIVLYAVIPTKTSKAKYKVVAESGREYYCDTFRVYGRGIVFDDVYDNTVYVQGDLEILTNQKKSEK